MLLSPKKRILFLGVLPPIIHGQSIVTAQILSILRENEFNVKVIRIFDLGNKTTLFVKCFFLIKTLCNFFWYLLPSKQIVYLPAANSLFGNLRNAPFILFSKLFGHEVVIHFHTGDFNCFMSKQKPWLQKAIKWIFSYVNTIIILGWSIKENFSIIFHDKISIIAINNAIDIEDVQTKEPKTLNHSKDIHILYMSNLIKSKGYLDVLKAVNILYHTYGIRNIKTDFCGEFLDKDSQIDKHNFQNFVTENHLEKIVNLHGVVVGKLKESIINQADFFVLPTYYQTEAMPISILEALKAGAVVISTKHRAIPEMIIDNQTGCFVESNRPDQIADKILELITNEEKFNFIRVNGFEHLRNNFSEDLFSKRIVSLFKSL
jgi:glycosyltransferase involved in cell wall biosynthesis